MAKAKPATEVVDSSTPTSDQLSMSTHTIRLANRQIERAPFRAITGRQGGTAVVAEGAVFRAMVKGKNALSRTINENP